MISQLFINVMEFLIVIGTLFFVLGIVGRFFKTHTATVSVNTGDHESLVLQTNLASIEGGKQWAKKVGRLFEMTQARRKENHEAWLKIQAEALAEKTEKGLRPVS